MCHTALSLSPVATTPRHNHISLPLRSPHLYPLLPLEPPSPPYPAAVDHRPWCSSSPIDPTSSITRARGCSPFSPIEPTTAGRPPHRCTPPPDHRHRREPAMVSLLPPFTPNQGHHRPGSLPGHFPTDQRRPTGEPPASGREGGGGNFHTQFPRLGQNSEGAGPLSRTGRSPAVG
jgi:hypothetical protein